MSQESHSDLIKLQILKDCLGCQIKQIVKKLLLTLWTMAQAHNRALRYDSVLRTGTTPWDYSILRVPGIRSTYCRLISAEIKLCWHRILCFGKTMCRMHGYRSVFSSEIQGYHHYILLNITSETFFRNLTRYAMFACLSWINASEEQNVKYVWKKYWPLCISIHCMRDMHDCFITSFKSFSKNVLKFKNVIVILHFLHILLFIQQS